MDPMPKVLPEVGCDEERLSTVEQHLWGVPHGQAGRFPATPEGWT